MDIENRKGTPEKTVRKGIGSVGQRPGEASVKRRDKSCDSRGRGFTGRLGRVEGTTKSPKWKRAGCSWSRSKENSMTGERQYDINMI